MRGRFASGALVLGLSLLASGCGHDFQSYLTPEVSTSGHVAAVWTRRSPSSIRSSLSADVVEDLFMSPSHVIKVEFLREETYPLQEKKFYQAYGSLPSEDSLKAGLREGPWEATGKESKLFIPLKHARVRLAGTKGSSIYLADGEGIVTIDLVEAEKKYGLSDTLHFEIRDKGQNRKFEIPVPKAFQENKKSLLERRENVEFQWTLSEIFVRQDAYGSAIKSLSDALQLEPKLSESYLRVARLSMQIGDFDIALKMYRKAALYAIEGDSYQAFWDLRFEIAEAAKLSDKTPEALKLEEKLMDRAKERMAQGQWNAARRYVSLALRLAPWSPQGYYAMALITRQQNDHNTSNWANELYTFLSPKAAKAHPRF